MNDSSIILASSQFQIYCCMLFVHSFVFNAQERSLRDVDDDVSKPVGFFMAFRVNSLSKRQSENHSVLWALFFLFFFQLLELLARFLILCVSKFHDEYYHVYCDDLMLAAAAHTVFASHLKHPFTFYNVEGINHISTLYTMLQNCNSDL